MQKKTYAVLGLGRYGTAVAKELVKNGAAEKSHKPAMRFA